MNNFSGVWHIGTVPDLGVTKVRNYGTKYEIPTEKVEGLWVLDQLACI